MAIAVQMKDSLTVEVLDEDYAATMNALNIAIAKGNTFTSLNDMEGGHVMVNIPQILTIKEIHDTHGSIAS